MGSSLFDASRLVPKEEFDAGGLASQDDFFDPSQLQLKVEDRSWSEVGQDLGTSISGGVAALLNIGGTLYGLATGDMDNWGTETGSGWREYTNARKSPALKQAEALRDHKIAQADNQLAAAGTAFWETLSSPMLLTSFLAEQVPMLGPVGAAGRGVSLGAKALGAAKPALYGTGAAVGTGAAMQGADAGEEAYRKLQKIPKGLWLENSRLQEKLAAGMPFEGARDETALELSRNAAIASAVVSGVTNVIPGAMHLERVFGGAALPGISRLGNALVGFAGEALQEGLEEGFGQYAANVAAGQVDPTQESMEDVGKMAGLGAAAGPFGAVAGAVGRTTEGTAAEIMGSGSVDEAIDRAEETLNMEVPQGPQGPQEMPPDFNVELDLPQNIRQVQEIDKAFRQRRGDLEAAGLEEGERQPTAMELAFRERERRQQLVEEDRAETLEVSAEAAEAAPRILKTEDGQFQPLSDEGEPLGTFGSYEEALAATEEIDPSQLTPKAETPTRPEAAEAPTAINEFEERAKKRSDPIQVVQSAIADNTVYDDLADLRQTALKVEKDLMRKYGVKRSEGLEDAPLTDAERNFLYYSDAPTDATSIDERMRLIEPVEDIDEAATELSRAARGLPKTANLDDMSESEKLATARLLFLGSEIERLGGDSKQVVLGAISKEFGRHSDPEDAAFMARSMAERLQKFVSDAVTPGDETGAATQKTREYANRVVGPKVSRVWMVGSAVDKADPNDIDILYELTGTLPKGDAGIDALTAMVEQSNIDLDSYDTFVKAGNRYFHLSKGAGREWVENADYANEQRGRPRELLAGDVGPPAQSRSKFDSSVGESSRDSVLANTKLFGDRANTEAVRVHGFDSLDRQRQHVVLGQMTSAMNDHQVFRSIVESVPIDVVDGLVGSKLSVEDLLHNPSMLTHRLSVPRNVSIPKPISRFVDSLSAAVERISAEPGAEKSGLAARSPSSEGQFAIETNAQGGLDAGTATKGPGRISNARDGSGENLPAGDALKVDESGVVHTEVAGQPVSVNINPTLSQKEAGNYKKGAISLHGFDISIENPKGSTRSGVNKSGKKWSVPIKHDYGYIKRTRGADDSGSDVKTDIEHVDVFIGPNLESQKVFVIDQVINGKFDEHKVMLGFNSENQARRAYLANYQKGWNGLGSIVEMPMEEFKQWAYDDSPQGPTGGPLDIDQFREGLQQVDARIEKQEEQRKKAGSRFQKSQAPDPLKDSLVTLAAKRGGLNIEAWVADGVDPEVMRDRRTNNKIFGRPAFRRSGGMTPDELGELMVDWGYIAERPTANEVVDFVLSELNQGQPYMHPEARSQLDEEAIRAEEEDRYGADYNPLGYDDLTAGMDEDQSAMFHALVAMDMEEDARMVEARREAIEELANEAYDEYESDVGGIPAAIGASSAAETAARSEEGPSLSQEDVDEATFGELETEEQRRDREAAEQARISAEETARAEDARRYEADQNIGGFQLTGSGREADVLAAQGQEGLDFTAEPEPESRIISDFGEKIGGAAKDTYNRLAEAVTQETDVQAQPLSKSFPKPDYPKLIEEGLSPEAAVFIAQTRKEIPNKPRTRGVARWAEKVESARKITADLMSGKISVDRLSELMRQGGMENRQSYMQYTPDIMALAKDLSADKIETLGSFKLEKHHFSLYKGEKDVTKWGVTNLSKKAGMGGMRNQTHFDSKEQALDFIKRQAQSDSGQTTQGKTKLDIWSERGRDGVFIGKKVGARKFIELHRADSISEARDYLAKNESELLEKLDQKKKVPSMRREVNDARTGPDYRNGKDVTPQQFDETFGFRGVEFGNWVEQGKRQQDINDAYDGLMDLANLLDVPPKALSLNGQLGLAFGARGRGGKDPAAAHYEPDRVVINLTKKQGAGSLAHEWFHSLDNYFNRMRDLGGFVTNQPRQQINREGTRDEAVRPEVLEAFKGIVDAINSTGMITRARELDTRKTKDYWATVEELAARAFEKFIIDKAQESEQKTDYLANIVDQETWEITDEVIQGQETDTYPYPTNEEAKITNAAYQNLFDVLETKETDKGIALFSKMQAEAPTDNTKAKVEAAIQAERDAISGLVDLNVSVIAASEIPDNIAAQLAPGTRPKGFSIGNDVYLIADHIRSDRDAKTVFAHEVKGHVGVNNIVEDWDALKSDYQSLKKLGGTTFNSVFSELTDRYGALDEETEVKEFIAIAAERRVNQGPVGRFLRKVREAFKAGLKKIGFKTAFSMTDIDAILSKSEQFLGQAAPEGQSAFSQQLQAGALFSDNQSPEWFSALHRAATNLKQEKGTGGQMLAMLRKQAGVKAEEMAWTGLEEFLAGKRSVTRQEIQDYLEDNLVQVEDVTKRENIDPTSTQEMRSALDSEGYTAEFDSDSGFSLYDNDGEYVSREDWPSSIETAYMDHESGDIGDGAKYGKWQLPGGENYREVLLTLPVNPDAVIADADERGMSYRAAQESASFKSSHWDERSVLAHIRLNDRVDAEGRKTLFVEEIQSDWHSSGRKKGYKLSPEREAEVRARIKELESIGMQAKSDFKEAPAEVKQEWADLMNELMPENTGRVPDAPFKNNAWVELAAKKILRIAAEGGYDRVAWTTGDQQGERYDLSKQLSEVRATNLYGGIYKIEASDHAFKVVINEDVAEKDLPSVVGKELAEKIVAQKAKKETYSGLDLKVGGEGMKSFYDRTLPNIFKKVAGKYDKSAKVATATLDIGEQQSILVTDKIADSVMMGQPLFSLEQTKTPEFREWFGDSKVVDEKGEPLVVYHGSPVRDFDEFDLSRVNENDPDAPIVGFWFSEGRDDANRAGKFPYGRPNAPNAQVRPFYLRITNPATRKDVRDARLALRERGDGGDNRTVTEELKRRGFDGYMHIRPIRFTAGQRRELEETGRLNLTRSRYLTWGDERTIDLYDDAVGGHVTGGWKTLEEFQEENPGSYVAFRPEQIKSATGNQGTFDPNDPNILFSQERDYTDAQKRALEKGKFGARGPEATFREKYEKATDRVGVKLRQGVLDQFASLNEVLGDRRAWIMAQLSKSAPGALEATMNDGRPRLQDNAIVIDLDEKSFIQLLEPLGQEVNDWLAWVAGNRAEMLSQQDRERLFEQSDIEALKSLAQGVMPDGQNRSEVYENVRQDYEALNQAVVQIAVDTGLVNAEEAQEWADQGFYVPFYRMMEDETRGPGGFKSSLAKQTAYKKLKGADIPLDDLLVNIMMNWNHLLGASLNNQAAVQSLETAADMGLAEEVSESEAGKNAVWVRKGGEKVWYELEDSTEGRLVTESLMSLNYQGLNNFAMKTMRKFKRALTIGVTVNPEFRIANLLRDTLHSAAVVRVSINIVKNVVDGIRLTKRGSESQVNMLAGGGAFGQSGYIHGTDPELVRRTIAKGLERDSILDTRNRIQKMWDTYQDWGARMENINRAAAFSKALKDGKDYLEANFEARDLLDFTRTGAFPAVRVMTQSVPFLNARLQGLDKMYRAVKTPEQQRQFATVVGVYSLASVGLYLMMRGDPDYEEAEEWEKDAYHLFKIPGSDVMYRFPRPFEVGFIATVAERMAEQLVDDEAHGELFAERMLHGINETLSFNPIPQAAMPIFEVIANKNFFTDRPIENMSMERLSPEERKRAWTSQTAIGLSQGISKVAWKEVTLSPVQIEHLVNGYFGWAGGTVLGAIDMLVSRPLAGVPGRPERRIEDLPVIGRFAREGDARNSKYITKFYDNMVEINQAWADIRQARELGNIDKARDKVEANRDLLRYRKAYNQGQRNLSRINKAITLITLNEDMAPGQKRERIDKLNRQKKDLAQRIVRATDVD